MAGNTAAAGHGPRVLSEESRDAAGTVTRHLTYLDPRGQIVRSIVVRQEPCRGGWLGVSWTASGLLHIARATNGVLSVERIVDRHAERLELERTPSGQVHVFSVAPDGRRRLLSPAEHGSTLQEVTLLTAALASEAEWDG